MWKVSQILKVRDRSQGMGQTTSILLTGEEDLQSQKRFDLPQSDHDFNTVLDSKTDSRFHKTSSNSSSSQSKQLPPQYLTFLKTTKTSKRNKNVLREENYSPCCIITTTSASSSQKIWAELAGVPHRCYAFTFVDVNAPQNHNGVQLDESCSSGSQTCQAVELC